MLGGAVGLCLLGEDEDDAFLIKKRVMGATQGHQEVVHFVVHQSPDQDGYEKSWASLRRCCC